MSEYDDVCNEVVGDLAVVIYHREQEIEKLKQDRQRLITALKETFTYTIKLDCKEGYCAECGWCSKQRALRKLIKEMEDDKDANSR